MEDKEKIKELEAKLIDFAQKIGKVQGMLEVLIDLDRPVFINNKLKELQIEIND